MQDQSLSHFYTNTPLPQTGNNKTGARPVVVRPTMGSRNLQMASLAVLFLALTLTLPQFRVELIYLVLQLLKTVAG